MKDIIFDKSYLEFFQKIKEKIYKSQYEALQKVNKTLIKLYWDIGRAIAEKQEKLGWGKAVVENLAKDLQGEFPGIKGFSARNLWNMRNFYLAYRINKNCRYCLQFIHGHIKN